MSSNEQLEGIPPKPEPDEFKEPVAWLLGDQLIAGLKSIALYSAFGKKLDSRDWMRGEVITIKSKGKEDFWFDYIADTGDGQKATYSIAYLCLSNLWLTGDNDIRLGEPQEGGEELPRGQFLFVGGDTSYHIADDPTLAAQFQAPFAWAFEDLKERAKRVLDKPEDRRPLLGIPGNHDYFDSLDGFNRQFRRPLTEEDEKSSAGYFPQLSIPGFKRLQQASYLALDLPHGWWFWGLDSQRGKADLRQQEFFRHVNNEQIPKKLIVATPEPAIVFGKSERPETKEIAKTFKRIGLKRPFQGEDLPQDECRLDLSGDVHHYARYWGPQTKDSASGSPWKDNYASVVSGLGGAFLHPTHTNFHEVKEQALYPTADQSRKAVAERLLNPKVIFRGGYVWLVGALIAMLTYFATTVPGGSKTSLDLLTAWILKRFAGESGSVPTGLLNITEETLSWFGEPLPYTALLSGILIVASLVFSGILIYLAMDHTEELREEARKRAVTSKDYWPVRILAALAAVVPLAVILASGNYRASQLFMDTLFALVSLLVVGGLVAFAVQVGGTLHGYGGKAGFLFLGLWHGLLQLAMPLLLLRMGTGRTFAYALITALAFGIAGWRATRWTYRHSRYVVLVLWLLHGGIQLVLPFWFAGTSSRFPWWGMLVLAALVGMLTSCTWLGWYLAVSLGFNGHNNEVGGAARIENFKQFIRFRLSEDGLTAYVIAIDRPETSGSALNPRLVESFRLAPLQ